MIQTTSPKSVRGNQDDPVHREVPVAAYADRLSVREGERLAFKVSCTMQGVESLKGRAWLTRSICADANPEGPGIIETSADRWFEPISFTPRHQRIQRGSCVRVESTNDVPDHVSWELSALIWPTRRSSSEQCVLVAGSRRLLLDQQGRLCFCSGNDCISLADALSLRQWVRVTGRVDAEGKMTLMVSSVDDVLIECVESQSERLAADSSRPDSQEDAAHSARMCGNNARFVIAAEGPPDRPHSFFNGKIESPRVRGGNTEGDWSSVAAWNFCRDMSSTQVIDEGPHGFHGTLVNYPARAMAGSKWDGSEHSWKHAPDHYAAIHFHDDDLVDADWQTDFDMTVAPGTPSGVYLMHIEVGEHRDAVPFYVCAPTGQPGARVCVLIPTFTYSVYGNHARPDWETSWQERVEAWGAYPWNPAEYPGYGLSTYNTHSDGSGICHASHRRPLFNLRPGYITFCNVEGSGLRHFQADSHLIAWLHEKDIAYDVITDRELHDEGSSCIEAYDVLMTTSHPEYHTSETLNALTSYRDSGGHLMYLGGNGFYWRIALHPEDNNVIEIRRAEDGIRAWAAEPGEYYQAFDGAYGGLWRRNGRPPQQLVGVGFSAQGQFNGSYYRRAVLDDQTSDAFAWAFNGIDEECIGDFGLCGGGAAGFELDRADARLGTPENATVLASSEGHGDDFVLVPEEVLTHLTTLPGVPADRLLRADIVWFDQPAGGAVFSVGSITFCGSLPCNHFDNNVSTLLNNVLQRMLSLAAGDDTAAANGAAD